MAINTIKATMQMRKGLEKDFDPDQMTAGEWAVSTDTKYVRMCFAPGICLRMATYEAFEEDMKEIQTILATCQDIQEAVKRFEELAEQHKNDSEASASAAAQSEKNAYASAETAVQKAGEAGEYAESAENSKNTASQKAEDAVDSAEAAAQSESNALASKNAAEKSAEDAQKSAETATQKASESSQGALTATAKAGEASDYATEAESWAHGETGTRENENVDNSKYYYEQAKRISQGLQGSLLPMGTITFSQLADQNPLAGYMYNISDNFTTDETFKDGAGNSYPAGTNVYWTADGYWDALAGVMVAGVKGSSETEYRQGFVNISKENIGLGNVDNTADAEKNVKYSESAGKAAQDGNGKDIDSTYLKVTGDSENNTVSFTSNDAANPTAWTDASLLATGEKHSSLFNKISTMFQNIRYLYKILGTSDISALGGGTVTGAINELNINAANEEIPENITSIVALISLVPVGKTKVFFIGSVPSGRLTDFPSVLSGLAAEDLVTITIKRTSTWSYIKVNSCVATGVNYTLDGLYNGTNLYWGEGDAALNSNLSNKPDFAVSEVMFPSTTGATTYDPPQGYLQNNSMPVSAIVHNKNNNGWYVVTNLNVFFPYTGRIDVYDLDAISAFTGEPCKILHIKIV